MPNDTQNDLLTYAAALALLREAVLEINAIGKTLSPSLQAELGWQSLKVAGAYRHLLTRLQQEGCGIG